MDKFTINDIENLCGTRAHTLRIWEKRYGLLKPERNAGKQRSYNNEELKFMLRVSYLYHSGNKISKIAALHENEFQQLTSDINTDSEIQLFFISRLLQAAVDFNEEAFDEILVNAIERVGLYQCLLQIVYPYFEKLAGFG